MINVSKRRRAAVTVGSGNHDRHKKPHKKQIVPANAKKLRPDMRLWTRTNPRPLLTVFGSSRARQGSALYNEGYRLGQLLGKGGFNLATGGYPGVMEAVIRGAHDTGAHVVGVTMTAFEDKVNPYVMDEISTNDFYQRLRWLVDRPQGYIAMLGGMGTLAEMTFTWQKLWLKMLPPRPYVLLGAAWRPVLKCWLDHLIVEPDDYDCFTVADTPDEACAFMRNHFDREPRTLSAAAR